MPIGAIDLPGHRDKPEARKFLYGLLRHLVSLPILSDGFSKVLRSKGNYLTTI